MTVRKIKSIGDIPYPIDVGTDALSPLLTAGAALGITGDGPTETAAWLQRTSTSDGPTTIRSIHGNTIVQDGELLPVNMTGIESTAADESWTQTRSIPAGTLRGAGSVFDELTATQAITRIGEVDLGTLSWSYVNNRLSTDALMATIKKPTSASQLPDIQPEKYDVVGYGASLTDNPNSLTVLNTGRIMMYAASADAPTPTGMLHYALATPTTVEIDPPLNLTYRTEQGGSERVMVPTGELSAPPTLVTAQGYTAESLRDAALSAIAPVENGLASTNYGVGSYLVHGGQLCKVTTAIASGEAITIGTNVTATTVMAEVIALIAQ